MAALGKIRSKGVFLIIIIGLGLFGFIAGDMFRSCEATGRAASNKAAVIFGEKVDIQEYQKYVEQYVKSQQLLYQINNQEPPADEALRENAWESFQEYNLFKHECDELGLTVTDDEFVNCLVEGENEMLQIFAKLGFVDEGTGKFSVQKYRDFMKKKGDNRLEDYELVLFLENEIRRQLLMQKYQVLVRSTILPNPYETQLALDANSTESDVKLAYIDYNSINDKDVQYNDADIKKKYEELKNSFYNSAETRAVKMYYVTKEPTSADKQKLENEMSAIAEQLNNTDRPDTVVRANRSAFHGMLLPKNVYQTYPQVMAKLDSMSVGQVVGPIVDMMRDKQSYSVVKLIDKATKNDSIGYKAFGLVVGQNNVTAENINTKADSIVNAIKNGADFKEVAMKYGVKENAGDTLWTSMNEVVNASRQNPNFTIPGTYKEFRNFLDESNVADVKTFKEQEGTVLIVQVINKKHPIEMVNVALVQKDLEFSKETSTNIDKKFNDFLAKNKTSDALKSNAEKSGINMVEIPDLNTDRNGIPDVVLQNNQVMPNTAEALRWAFTGKKDEISKIYSVSYGSNKEVKMVLVISGINKKGQQTLDNINVKKMVEELVKKDKKAEKIIAQLKDVKSVDQAKEKNANVIELPKVSLGIPISNAVLPIIAPPTNPYAPSPGEPALNGAIAKTQKGQFSSHPVRGQYGVYVFEVIDKRTAEVDEGQKMQAAQQIMQENTRKALNFRDLYLNAEVEDNRNLH